MCQQLVPGVTLGGSLYWEQVSQEFDDFLCSPSTFLPAVNVYCTQDEFHNIFRDGKDFKGFQVLQN